ncbi:MAG TPA: pyridoxamine 5'-phosphate oxidase family protein [Candidatus Omnitrophota bacterium]|nr:pyridoxamine 5'-phosphate oxidase family protein [Candidatus Omnitrophota bacterium]
MTFYQLQEFMKSVPFGMLATSDGKRVGVRPVRALYWAGKELWCGIEEGQEKIDHLKKVPYAEYCFAAPDGAHVRIAGPCMLSTSLKDKARLWSNVLSLHKFYETPSDPMLVVLRMKPKNVRVFHHATYDYRAIKI